MEQFVTSVGLRQEDTLSCILFNLAFKKVIKDSEIETKGTIYEEYSDMCLCRWYSSSMEIHRCNEGNNEKLMKAEQVMRFTNKMQKKKYIEVIQKPISTNMLKTDNQNMRG